MPDVKTNLLIKVGMISIILLLTVNSVAVGANTASQDITVSVEPINEISVTGTVNLTINTSSAGISAGDGTFTVTDSSSTMSYTTNESSKKITAALDGTFNNITFMVNVTSSSATSEGDVPVSVTAVDVVTGLGNASDTGETITYTAEAQPNTAPNADGGGETNTITFTLTDAGI